MKIRTAPKYPVMRFKSLFLVGVFAIVAAALAVPLHSARSSSKKVASPHISNGKSAKAKWSSVFTSPNAPVADVATFNSDCVTPQTDFFLGDVVCAKAVGVPNTLFPWQVLWVDQDGFIRQSGQAVANDATTYLYTLPATPTSVINDRTVDNRGNWQFNVARSNGSIRDVVTFVVHEANNPIADAFVQKVVRTASGSVAAGDNISFFVVVGNTGPDEATNVHLVDAIPAGTTLVQFTQNSGPACVPADLGVPNDCVIASLSNGDRASFTAIYNTAGLSPGDYQASASISPAATDPDNDNNTYSSAFTVTTSTGGTACQIICPDNINANADTTEGGQRGAHVTYDAPVTSGDCGSISSVPASGSFFPIGVTVVNVTSETGDGACSFTVTVEDHGNTASISCPSSQTVNADSNCQATVSVGTPTVTGDNVTVFATRSDGQPMYDCDGNGNCTRHSPDAPFAAGTTTITWTATSHDIAGPYATAEDEVAHRTGVAQCNQTITVVDVTPPTITASNLTVSADANCQAAVPDYSTIAVVSDNCACASSDNSQICDSRQDIKVTQDVAAGTLVGLGAHTIHLTANDGSSNNGGAGNTTTISVTFTVNDTTPPTFTFVPPAITAYTGPNATTCDTVVDPGTATASDNCGPVTITRSPSGNTFAVGTTTITWTATDGAGNSTTATQTITVIDNTPPVITLNGLTPSLWPPNHKYVTFTVANFVSSVFDNCGGVSVSDVKITQATSDETENGNGDGNTTNDIIIGSDCKSLQLRAERDGGGDGRVYTITFSLTDTHGNTTTATANVVVPHNPGQTPVNSGVHYTVSGNCP